MRKDRSRGFHEPPARSLVWGVDHVAVLVLAVRFVAGERQEVPRPGPDGGLILPPPVGEGPELAGYRVVQGKLVLLTPVLVGRNDQPLPARVRIRPADRSVRGCQLPRRFTGPVADEGLFDTPDSER